jgi:hypothetical protein
LFVFFLTGRTISRRDLGLPQMWTIVMSWLSAKIDVTVSNTAEKWSEPELKNPEIPVLDTYEKPAKTLFGMFSRPVPTLKGREPS